MSVRYQDSLNKIESYLKALCVHQVKLSPLFYRDYSCPAGCGGCCPKFSLVYFPGERWERFKKEYPDLVKRFHLRFVKVAGQLPQEIYEDTQSDNMNHHCINLDMQTGRCKIHTSNPFSCEFELMKVSTIKDKTYLINKLFGRGWALTKIDGERGAMCKMKDFSYEKFLRDVSLLKELYEYSIKLNYDTILPEVLAYFEFNDQWFKEGLVPSHQIVINKIQI